MKLGSRIFTVLLLLALMVSIIPGSVQTARAATCNWAQFVADVTIPDGTNFAPNTAFKKTWRLKNIGTCAWNSSDVSLAYDSGEKMNAPTSVALPVTVNPGQTVDITVDMTSPAAAGHYFGYWKFKSASGGLFGIGTTANKSFWVEINVTSSSGTGYDFTANAGSAAWSSGAGALTFPGTDGNASGFALKQDKPKFESGIESAQAGLLFQPHNITNGFVQGAYPAFRVLSGDRFQATIGCENAATQCYIAYRLDYQIGSGPVTTFWTFREKYEGWTYNVNLDLSSLANQDVKFILVVNASGSPTGDRALWGNPVIARAVGAPPAPTATGTPATPTITKTPGTVTTTVTPPVSNCDKAQFIADVTVPDGTMVAPAATFKKTWRLKNIGSCTWTTAYTLIFDSGEKMNGPSSAPMPTNVAPGQTVDISVDLTAPNSAGTYRGYWKFKNSIGATFGIGTTAAKSFWVEIKVSGATATPVTSTAVTSTVTPATPIAGSSYDFAANICAATWFSGAGQLPCPGSDGDARGFVIKQLTPKLENGTIDTRPGLLTVPQNVQNGYIQGFYPVYKVKAGDKFRSTVTCEANATSCYVVFRLDYQVSGGSIQTYWAFVENFEGAFYEANLDLTPLVGQDVKFILTVLATGPATGDRAIWVAPVIYNSIPGATSTSTATSTPTSTPTATATSTTAPLTSYKFDFGTAASALATGYTRITETTLYPTTGFGWLDTSSLSSRDRGTPADPLTQDLVMNDASAAKTFKVDLANGTYNVVITMGDSQYAHDNMVVKVNGANSLLDVDNAVGAFTVNTIPVTVSGGSITIEISDSGGSDPTWVVNAIVINSVP